MRKNILFSCIISAIFLLYNAAPLFSVETIKYSGCGIVKKAFMGELARKFTGKQGIKVEIDGGGATAGIRNVASGKTVLGGTCRYALEVPEEKGVKLYHVAWDSLVVIVNPGNPVDTISLEQLKGVLDGKIKDWSELGGPKNMPIEVYIREGKISGVGMMARDIIYHDPNREFAALKKFKSTGPLEKAVEQHQWAIGVTGVSSARKRNVKILKLNGIETSKNNIASGKYLLYRPLYLVTRESADPLAKKFVEFALSQEGQRIISEQGTVNLREGARLWRLYRKQIKDR